MNYATTRKRLIQEAAKQHIPIAGEFELTSFCNLKCKMCYVRESKRQMELSTQQWISLIKEAKDAGLLFCLFTGGEIFTRSDFKEIYEATYDMGIRITLFTNGTLISDEIVSMLAKRPPEFVAITLYGASNKTYEKITQQKNGYDLVKQGIEKLQKYNINLMVRTIAIKDIYQEMDQLIAFIKENHLLTTYSLYVGPRRNISIPCEETFERLTPLELLEYRKVYEKEFGLPQPIEFGDCESGFKCVAGKSAYFVTWDKRMTPCAMLSSPSIKIENSFINAWNEFHLATQDIPLCKGYENCAYKKECLQCPARRYLEGGFDQCSPYLREIAKVFKEDKQKNQH